jgi:hypothetical protein
MLLKIIGIKSFGKITIHNLKIKTMSNKKETTLEEAAERLSKDAYKKHSLKDDRLSLDEQIQRSGGFIVGFKEGLKEGAKWQAERLYSEEEVYNLLYNLACEVVQDYDHTPKKLDKWFEQFKKK